MTVPVESTGPQSKQEGLHTLEDLPFEANHVRQVHNAFYSFVAPTPTDTEPCTVLASQDVAGMIGLDPAELERPEFALAFSGNMTLPGTKGKSYAQCYGGHQFGSWAGQLGDGRAISLGEAVNPAGEHWELQLKGAGRTPYSRFADGRAVLRSSIREYVASEAMAALGVPTTRALALVATGDQVMRDMFYNGNARLEPGAVVCRVARCFVRFGTFQLPATRGDGQTAMVNQLADYVIKHHYPHLQGRSDAHAAFFREVCERTGRLVAEWHRVGFVHGVLNTDNMSILGDTIDYGPYGWLERFNPDFTPNTTDLPGRRYCFRNQPEIGQFNVAQLARALLAAEAVTQEEAQAGVEAYAEALTQHYEEGMARKLGLKAYDREVAVGFMKLLFDDTADYTNSFRCLSRVPNNPAPEEEGPGGALPTAISDVLGAVEEDRVSAWREWLQLWRAKLQAEGLSEEERQARQDAANPAVVPRNHVLVEVINHAEQGDYAPLHKYMGVLLRPYSSEGVDPSYLEPAPLQCRMGVELLSCSS
ncbi:hypothetical protein N2152v2_006912 [Parachlorella kessleri]